jgi:tetratricopeptide (TPR) repeat protein
VIGLIRYNPPHPDAAEHGLGGIVFACPTLALRSLLDSIGIHPTIDSSQAEIPGLAIGAAAATRAPLPPDRREFIGRHGEIDSLLNALTTHKGGVVAIHGPPGVGKSALAIHVAHLVAAEFPDGRLHIDLRGADQRPIATMDALERLLHAMGLPPNAIALTEAGRLEQYRKLLAGKRALIVLDNARSAAQLRPLLPRARNCSVLVTSRQPMSALDEATLLSLGALTSEEAARLLIAMLCDDPRTQDRAGLDELTTRCDHLPLAIRIAAAQLRSRPHWTVRHVVSRLADERHRLSVLAVDDLAVRASFDSSYAELSQAAAQAFAAVGGLSGPDFPPWTVAALLNISLFDAEELLNELADAQLVSFARLDVAGGHRYRCHDLLRAYAAERAIERFDDVTRRASRARLYSGYLALLVAAMSDLGPGKDLFLAESVPIVWQPPAEVAATVHTPGPIDWFTDERASLVAAARRAYEDELWPYVWGIIDVLNGLFLSQRHGYESLELKDLALKASQAADDPAAEAGALYSYMGYYMRTGEYAKAADRLSDVLARYRALGMRDREARTMLTLAVVERDQGRLAASARWLGECMDVFLAGNDDLILASTRQNYAVVLRDQGFLAASADALAQSLPVFYAHDDRSAIGRALHTRAVLNCFLGRISDAEADLDEARPMCVSAGDAHWTAIVDLSKARLLGHRARWSEVLIRLPECEKLFQDNEDNLGIAQAWRTRGAALRALGDLPGSLVQYAKAAAVYEVTSEERTKARLTYGTALTLLRGGDTVRAGAALTSAESVFVDLDDQCWLLRTRRWQAAMREDRDGRTAAAPAWTEVRRLAETLIERAGPGFFPEWLRPILLAAQAGSG